MSSKLQNLASTISLANGDILYTVTDPSGTPADKYITKANLKTDLGLTGTNTGDQDLSGLAVKANNLSDLTNASAARTNLGLGTLATQSGTFSGTSSGTNTGDQTSVSGNAGTVTNGVYTTDTGTVTNTMLAGSIASSKLLNTDVANLTGTNTGDQDLSTLAPKASPTFTGTVVLPSGQALIAPALGTPASGVMTNVTGTASGLTAGNATQTNALKSATTTINVASATAPTTGQVLTATGASAATWQTPSGGSTVMSRLIWSLEYPLGVGAGGRVGAALSASATITSSGDTGYQANTNGGTGRQATFFGRSSNLPLVNFFDKALEMSGIWYDVWPTTGNYISYIVFGSGTDPDTATGNLTVKHLGFIIDTGIIYASSANGTTQTKTDITSGLTIGDNVFYLKIVLDPGVSAKFYINGTLKTTITTNLPSGAFTSSGGYFRCGIINDAGDTASRVTQLGSVEISWPTA